MTRQFITVEIADQWLGVDIMAVREIRAWSPATPLPNTPEHIRGVVNLRGVVLPVLDLSGRLGWGTTSTTERHAIVVVEIGSQLQGIIVDGVNDIVSVSPDDLHSVPDTGTTKSPTLLEGLAHVDGRLVLVLALDQLGLNDTEAWKEAA
ncbi:chemotaxis protein CheW [Sphingomonas quercus]|uniref:Chemotaxis protein CheW n=1 Tax=Sphingomonas quercus TaxID=2842451 RepID=A0ABS6BGA2_9SPHN|nr:chemotaxis protein CheW [Sphingomonas quercus]MBU3077326.1 chemotaxis protein CheW [Sphingomonas quercus]